jgi:NAD(P)-dependent dehydrogenase (short-subunit alcohol dehydrogenase family)
MQPQGTGDIAFDFTGRTAVVFGGTSGINYGIAEAFGRHGAKVAVASRRPSNVDAALERLGDLGVIALGRAADVRDSDAVDALFAEVSEQWGTTDVLVSGAAGNFLVEGNRLSAKGFKTVVDIDLFGTFHVLRQGFAHLAPGASVINISAPQASVPMRYQVHVGAAKAGVDQLTRVLALEWAAHGIRVNAISPGPIEDTDGLVRLSPDGDSGGSTALKHAPLGRLGTKRDVAQLAMFLASSGASYISGAVIPCDGGGAIDSVKPAIEEAGRAMNGRSR